MGSAAAAGTAAVGGRHASTGERTFERHGRRSTPTTGAARGSEVDARVGNWLRSIGVKRERVQKGLHDARAAEKRRSRKADARAVAENKKSRAQLKRENSLFSSGVKVRIDLARAKSLC